MAVLTAAERLLRLSETFGDIVPLAETLSLAVRLEPALIRELRLALWPASHASMESDLFFSRFIGQQTPDWICLDPQLARELQVGMSVKIQQDMRARER